jgi:hypothetical protein
MFDRRTCIEQGPAIPDRSSGKAWETVLEKQAFNDHIHCLVKNKLNLKVLMT